MKWDEERASCAVVFVASMVVYLLTLCPTVYSGDSGDLVTASYTTGVAHPGGYPFYMIVGKAFSYLPVGGVAYRYTLMSAVFSALAAVLVCLGVRTMTKSWIASLGSGLMVAFALSVWDQATVAKAYGLNGFFAALIVWLLLRFRQSKSRGWLTLSAFAFGLACTNHMSSVFALPAYAYLAVAGNRKVLSKMDLRPLAVLVVLPALLYFWVYLRANSDPVYNWNNPNTLGRFIIHVSAYVHRQTYVFTYTSSEFFERFFGILYHYVKQYSLAGLLVLFGLYRHGGKNWVFLNFTAMLVAIDTFYALFLNEASLDITTFCLPSIIVLGIWSGFLFEDVFRWIRKETEDRMWQYAAVASVALFLVAVNYWTNDKSQNLIAYDYGMNVLKSTDQGAIIFADGDNVVLPLAYILYAEGARKDVTLYERGGLLSHKLYGEDYIFLDEQSHAKRQYEREYQLIKGNRPVYYTSDPEVDYPGYKLVQTGLIYRVVPENDTISDKDYFRLYDTRQVFNNTIYTDYMTNNIRASYYIRLAQYIGAGDKDRAIDILKQAQGILPDNMAIRYELGKLLLLKREYNGAIAEFKEAIRIDQKSAKAYLNLGSAYAQKGEFEAAKQGYLEALKLDPSYLKARFNLATILAAKNPAESINQYLIIIRSDPTYANAYFNLGMVYDSIGRKQEAKAMWSKYLEIQPNGQTASSARAKLAGGNSTTV